AGERVHVAAYGRPPRRRVQRASRIGVHLRGCAAPCASVPAAGRLWTNWHEIVAKDTSRRRRGRGNVGLEGGGLRPPPGGGYGRGAGVFGHGSKGQWTAAPERRAASARVESRAVVTVGRCLRGRACSCSTSTTGPASRRRRTC